jgi:hypothetical protein
VDNRGSSLKTVGRNIVGIFSSINPPLSGINASRRDTRYLLKEIKRLGCLKTKKIYGGVEV